MGKTHYNLRPNRNRLEERKERLANRQKEFVDRMVPCNSDDRETIGSSKNGSQQPTKKPRIEIRDVGVEPRDAVDVFPEEVWGLIIDKISEKDDLWKVGRTCSLLEEVALKPSKNDWLFRELFPLLEKYLSGSSILKCRQINKFWNEVVDDFFQKLSSGLHPDTGKVELESWHHSFLSGTVGLTKFKKFQAVIWGMQEEYLFHPRNYTIEAVTEMKNHQRNPFLLRSFLITYFITRTMDNTKIESWTSFMKNLGKHLWHVELKTVEFPHSPPSSRIQFAIHELLLHTPYLRSFTISFCSGDEDQEENPHEQLPDVGSLPDLADLEYLELRSPNKLRGDILPELEKQLITKYHAQLKTLAIYDHRVLNWPPLGNFYWDNLLELIVAFETTRNLEVGADPLLYLKAPNLRKITVTDHGSFPYMLGVLNQLSKRMPKLHILRLNIRRNKLCKYQDYLQQLEGDTSASVYASPNFTVLEIDTANCRLDVFFILLGFTFVEKLRILNYKGLTKNVHELVEVSKFLKKKCMHESNIWRMMPRLKTLSVQGTEYTRKGYETFMRSKSY